MLSHAPVNYECPFCLFVAGVENEAVRSRQTDRVFADETVTAFVGAKQWPHTPGHVLVVPNAHWENLYDLPVELGADIFAATQKIACAMKEIYGCRGISTRQHNEPAGNQDVWHFHVHVYPRWEKDDLYPYKGAVMPFQERAVYATKLRAYFER